jgi:hypothetical protein
MHWSTAALLGFGAMMTLVNVHYSALALVVHRLRNGRLPREVQLGVPLLGTLSLLAALALGQEDGMVVGCATALMLIDTGGPVWIAVVLLRRRLHAVRLAAQRAALNTPLPAQRTEPERGS